jgi:hypothetical protein
VYSSGCSVGAAGGGRVAPAAGCGLGEAQGDRAVLGGMHSPCAQDGLAATGAALGRSRGAATTSTVQFCGAMVAVRTGGVARAGVVSGRGVVGWCAGLECGWTRKSVALVRWDCACVVLPGLKAGSAAAAATAAAAGDGAGLSPTWGLLGAKVMLFCWAAASTGTGEGLLPPLSIVTECFEGVGPGGGTRPSKPPHPQLGLLASFCGRRVQGVVRIACVACWLLCCLSVVTGHVCGGGARAGQEAGLFLWQPICRANAACGCSLSSVEDRMNALARSRQPRRSNCTP